jgi:protein-tyrosine phosphatase
VAVQDIFWISPVNRGPQLPLAIALRPHGGKELEGELRRIKKAGIHTLVSLLEDWEAEYLGLSNEAPLAKHVGLAFLSHPIPDRQTPPDAATFRIFVADLTRRLHAGESIGVHCRGSIGRSTVLAACVLIHLGWSPVGALAAVATARGCLVPDTPEQRDWILRYQGQLWPLQ